MSISKKLRFEILQRDGFRCQYCGREGPEVALEIDHIKPRARGGTDDPENLTVACFMCNRGKSDKPLIRKNDEEDPLLGLYFHRPIDKAEGNFNQGIIEDKIQDGYYLCRLFSWVDGGPTNMVLAELDEIVDWYLYNDVDYWRQEGRRLTRQLSNRTS